MPALEWLVVEGGNKPFASAAATVSETNAAASKGASKSTKPWRLPTLAEVTAQISEQGGAATGLKFSCCEVNSCWVDSGKGFDLAANKLGESFEDSAELAIVLTREIDVGPAAPTKKRLVVSGYMDCSTFQQCVEAAEYLNKVYTEEYQIDITREFAFEFEKKRSIMLKEGKEGVEANTRVLVTNKETGAMESGESFVSTICATTDFKVFNVSDDDENSYLKIAQRSFTKFLRSKDSEFCWIMVRVVDQLAGRIVFQLYTGLCPRTSENFIHLCKGDLPDATIPAHKNAKGETVEEKTVKLSYKGSSFFRVVHGGWIQAGDITSQTAGGNQGHSIYGARYPDECFTVKHDQEGILGMANEGEHTNNSQFYVTLAKASWMDRRYVAFGRVVEGLDVMRRLGEIPTRHNQTPKEQITIDDCGHMQLQ